MKPYVSGHVAFMEGPTFNLSLVLSTHEFVLDKLLANAGPVTLTSSPERGTKRYDWPTPGKNTARLIWDSLKKSYDVDARALVLLGSNRSVQVRMLGNTWVVQDAASGELKLHDGKPLAAFNPMPNLTVLGPWDGTKKAYRLLTAEEAESVGELVDGPLKRLKLGFERITQTNHQTLKTGFTDYVRITFPYGSYGLRRDVIAVRCVSSDGEEPDPSSHVEN